MKIGLLTFHFSENFGAALQAYALRQWLRRAGHEAEFINYQPSHLESGLLTFRGGVKGMLKAAYLQVSSLRGLSPGAASSRRKFAAFRVDQLGVVGPALKELTSHQLQKYDLLLCGSDQIWNPSDQYGIDPTYFLDVPGHVACRRVSYAASFGRDRVPTKYHGELKRLLIQLDAISVRERSGAELVRSLSDINPTVVPDPTILLGDFSELLGQRTSTFHDAVFCYALRTDQGVRRVAAAVAKKLHAPIISPDTPHRRWPAIGRTVHAGPEEWLNMLDGSKIVVTNSFHGVALSLLRQKQFIAVTLPGKKAGLSTRIHNLLQEVGLLHLLIDDVSEREIDNLASTAIDWGSVDRALRRMRADGERFLISQLGSGGQA